MSSVLRLPRLPRLFAAIAFAVAAALLLAGCQFSGVANLPLPGGAAANGPTYHVTAIFDDVVDLVPQAAVRVDDVPVGSVEKITLDPATLKATVRMKIRANTHLPANAVAELRQTSLFGEKYVSLGAPTTAAPTGLLADGALIPVNRTGRNPEVEEVFSALSALVNGGGIGDLQSIAVELSAALSGRESRVRELLTHITTFTATLDRRQGDVIRAVDALDRLTTALVKQKQDIVTALDEFTPAVAVLAKQRADLTSLLTKLSDLGAVGTRVIARSKSDTLADLRALSPTLSVLAGLKTDIARTLVGVDQLTVAVPKAIPGDYLNLRIEFILDPSVLSSPPIPAGLNLPLPAALRKAAGGAPDVAAMLLGGLQ